MHRIILCAALVLASSGIAQGQQFKVLYSFAGYPTDGASPNGELVFDAHGNLYGTTIIGGATASGTCYGGSAGCGTVFRLSPSGGGGWTETELYSFCPDEAEGVCPDGNFPSAGLVIDHSGNLYGTTWEGGAFCGDGPAGCGTVFELSPPSRPGETWAHSVLHDFCNTLRTCNDGVHPESRLTFDALGNLYGTTVSGGSGGAGTVFELVHAAAGWASAVLYNFCSVEAGFCVDGEAPLSGVTFDPAGNLYGTTYYGGQTNSQGQGIIYELSPGSQGWTETVLFSLPVGGIEAGINTGVVFNSWGGIYSTVYGPPGAVLRFNIRTGFARNSNFNGGESGSIPSGDLLVDEKTNAVYGVTEGPLYGNVFKMAADGKETVLHSFCSENACSDGYYPIGSLVADHAGNLYGTTSLGGAYGYGVVFEITP